MLSNKFGNLRTNGLPYSTTSFVEPPSSLSDPFCNEKANQVPNA